MKKLIVIFTAFISALILTPAVMANDDSHGDGKLDPKEIIFEHLGDGYGWEVPFNHHKRIPLPVIVFGSDGLHIFSSSHITGGNEYIDGNTTFKLAGKDSYFKGKVIEIVDGK